ncbi:MAG: magnesium protoporphyrin IX methyltransferase [Oscillochloridaceae bacterium umkhey_bin13]
MHQVDPARHKAQLRQYFDGVGFARWSAIYGQGELSAIRRSIRTGHTTMLTTALDWLDQAGSLGDAPTALDAGCGTGLLTLALAERGFAVTASDLAPQMVAATTAAVAEAGLSERVTCQVADLEALTGHYDLVACFDVLIHYPAAPFVSMLRQLADRSRTTLLFTYAPHSPFLAAMHRIGGLFPSGQRRTTIQMIPDQLVQQTLTACGMRLVRSQRISSGFYHVTLVQAQRI